MFRFKQFTVDQSDCAMKVNTDGVLLGAMADAIQPAHILDIGAGTGVIALMLAQRFGNAEIDAVEIDETAAQTAARNFGNSPFKQRLTIYAEDFEIFFKRFPEKKYDLIVSNPPFYIHSLKSKGTGKALAKHADESFFKDLISTISAHLTSQGLCWLVLPLPTARLVKSLAAKNNLHICKVINLCSFTESVSHREILVFGLQQQSLIEEKFVIYNQPKIYSKAYTELLKDFLTIF